MQNLEPDLPAPAVILGEVASPGLARGRALLCECAKPAVVPRRQLSEEEAAKEIQRFDTAVSVAAGKLQEIQENIRRNLGNGEAEVQNAGRHSL